MLTAGRARIVIAIALLVGGCLALAQTSPAATPRTRPFAGNVCELVPLTVVPAEVPKACHRKTVTSIVPQAPEYDGTFGTAVEGKITKATHAILIELDLPRNSDDRSSFKGIISTLATINHVKPVTFGIGSWAREVRYEGPGGATFTNLEFVLGRYDCSVLFVNPTSLAERLAVARAIAASLRLG